MTYINPVLSAKRAAAGRAGGYRTFFRYGKERMTEWARLGGRPRLKTLEEILVEQSSRQNKERGKGCRPIPLISRGL